VARSGARYDPRNLNRTSLNEDDFVALFNII